MSIPVNTAPAALTYRQQQAAATKDRIATAAQQLFAAHGYGASSMEAIAGAAGVAVRTVYAAFGAKREILSHICERWLERARARERAAEVLAEPDSRRRLQGAASWLTALYTADFDVVNILDAAGDDSPETRDMLRAKLAGRNDVMDSMIASLDGSISISVSEAQAIFRALAAPGVYRELVQESGWSPARFEDWLGGVLAGHLFRAAA